MALFKFEPVEFPELKSDSSRDGRFYYSTDPNKETRIVAYPSVTTIIGYSADKTFLENWKQRVGEEAAEHKRAVSANRGQTIHKLVENYIETGVIPKGIMPSNLQTLLQFKKVLDANLTKVNAIEACLVSHQFRFAGRCDLIGDWNNVPSIIDHKTSGWEKIKEDINDYFIQATMYSMMLEEMKGMKHEQLVVIIGCDSTPEALTFTEDRKNYMEQTKEIIHKYHMMRILR